LSQPVQEVAKNLNSADTFKLVRRQGPLVLIYDINKANLLRKFNRQEEYINSQTVSPSPPWPPTLNHSWASVVNQHKLINLSGVPNYLGVRLPISSPLKIENWRLLLADYADYAVCDFLEFGFPVGYAVNRLPDSSHINHRGALNFSDHVDSFIYKEVTLSAALGPFDQNPLFLPLNLSALNTVEKRDSLERRIILDLSFPDDRSVNAGIIKGEYLGEVWNLTYPTIDLFASMILKKGRNCLMYKRDLKRAYRQFPVDPGDIHLLGYYWRNQLFFDKCLPFGLRTSAFCSQRVTSAIAHLSHTRGFTICNYIDDFGGVEIPSLAMQAYNHLGTTLEDLGVVESIQKAVPPSSILTFIGVQFDSNKLTMEVTPDRLDEIHSILADWSHKKTATKRDLQSLIGKLQYVAKCVRAGRIFISRLLRQLCKLNHQSHKFTLSNEFRKDLSWWSAFLVKFNGVCMLSGSDWSEPDAEFATDACLTGCGGINASFYFGRPFPSSILSANLHISALEILTVLIAVRLWCKSYTGLRIKIHCDNSASVTVLNSGRTKD
jgi:hypothetical protein